jgi:cytochrome P450
MTVTTVASSAVRPASLPPGPTAPAIVQTWRHLGNPLPYLQECRRRYGDVFTVRIAGFGPFVHIAHPADIRTLFTMDPESALAGEANHALFGALTGRGTLFTMEGAAHLRRRRLVMPAFHGERMQEYATIMRETTERAMASWPVGRAFSMHPELQGVALQVILRAVFGLNDGPESLELREVLTRIAQVAISSKLVMMPFLQWDFGPKSPWGRVMQTRRDVDVALNREIARRRAEPDATSRRDILSLLLQARDEDGAPLSAAQLRDELIVLLVAGHETTATSLAWAFASILERPEVLGKIREELDRECGDAPLGREALGKLTYLDAVIKESMRFRPITPSVSGRWLKAPLVLRDYTLPAGIFALASGAIVHKSPEIYPDPDAFKPERFLGEKADPYEWLPFGGGVRRCLGMAFALYEMKVVLATVLRRAALRLVAPPKLGRRGFFIAPADGTRVVMDARP